jgi:hypothetical protein
VCAFGCLITALAFAPNASADNPNGGICLHLGKAAPTLIGTPANGNSPIITACLVTPTA